MKKKISLLAFLTLVLVANAQTDFRHLTFEEAKVAAKAEGKMIFVDFYTQWCGPCKMLAKKVFPTQEIGDFLNAGYISLKLDAENEGMELAKSLEVSAYPTLAVFDADGNLTGSFAGYKEGNDFIKAVKEISDPSMKPEIIEEKYLSGNRTPGVVKAYAYHKYESGRNWEDSKAIVEPIVSDYFLSLSDTDRLKPENAFIFSSYTFDYDSPRAQFMITNRRKFDSSVKEDIEKAIEQIFIMKALDYLSSNRLADNAPEYEKFTNFKSDVTKNGFNDKLDSYIMFAEKRRTANDDEYLAFCDANLDSLDDTGVYYLVSSIPEIFSIDTTERKDKIASILRKHLAEMHASNVCTTGMILYKLENKD